MTNDETALDIAIVGMTARAPGARDADELWDNVKNGRECIRFFSDEELLDRGVSRAAFSDPAFVRAGGVLDDVDMFDAAFFGFSPREAEVMDPQHRIFLESAWQALENAGYDPETFPGSIGVYAGAGMNTYLLFNLLAAPGLLESVGDFQLMLTNDKDTLCTRASYKLNLRGPSVNIQTACSTSLVSIHVAREALLTYQCDLAIAGGVAIKNRVGYKYHAGGIASPDGHCRAFDERAAGTVVGDGCGLLVLRRLDDALADGARIRAVIKGSAINNDGSMKVSYTAPSVPAQAAVIATAMETAGVEPETIGYVEAHGTATTLGDPIEVAALRQAYRAGTSKIGFCGLGSVKTNIGHLDTAAGAIGLIKTVRMLEEGVLAPSLHFERPNPKLELESSPFFVPAKLEPWRGSGPRRAGVSSFGIGGTNAHVILEQAPSARPSDPPARDVQVLVLSARTRAALDRASDALAAHLEKSEDPLEDIAYTLQVGRRPMAERRVVVADDAREAARLLRARPPTCANTRTVTAETRAAFLFPGQGSQYPGMARGLYDSEPVFRETIDRACTELLRRGRRDLRALIYPSNHDDPAVAAELKETRNTQPALFIVEYALAQLLLSWGIKPAAMIGHSLGEYVAACLAGVFSLEDALSIVTARADLMADLPPGAMIAVAMREETARTFAAAHGLALAAVNGPQSCALSGPLYNVDAAERALAQQSIAHRRLETSHAFHSSMMDPILDRFESVVASARRSPPTLPFISNVSGTWIDPAEAQDPAYWRRHLRETVRFLDGAAVLVSDAYTFFEVGPGETLGTLLRGAPGAANRVCVSTTPSARAPAGPKADVTQLSTALGRAWTAGLPIDWARLYGTRRRSRVPLPTYPFERQKYWVAAKAPAAGAHLEGGSRLPATAHPRPALAGEYVAPRNDREERVAAMWRELLGIREIGVDDSFFELGGNSLIATQLVTRLRAAFEVDIPLAAIFEQPTIAGVAAALEGKSTVALHVPTVASEDAIEAALREAESAPREEPRIGAEGGRRPLAFSVFFFSEDAGARKGGDTYELLTRAAKFADDNGFAAVWTPERHFHAFGGLYPNPAVLGAAIAAVTRRIQIRAGSIVLPLQDPIRVAEEWSVVDHLSGGNRIALSFASGWHVDDFVLAPGVYAKRKAELFERIDVLRRLWSGERVAFSRGGQDTTVRIFPKPLTSDVPIWITSSVSSETWLKAAALGANVLTGLLEQDVDALAKKIALYREALAKHGYDPDTRCVTVMLHTFVGADESAVRRTVEPPLRRYLRTHLELYQSLGRKEDLRVDVAKVSERDLDALVTRGFERYYHASSLIGTPAECNKRLEKLRSIGVNEIGCLVDFGIGVEDVLGSLEHVTRFIEAESRACEGEARRLI